MKRHFIVWGLIALSLFHAPLLNADTLRTTDGKTYPDYKVIKVESDKIFITYEPEGFATVSKDKLPAELRDELDKGTLTGDSSTQRSSGSQNTEAIEQFNLGIAYAIGDGVDQDPVKAVACYRKAAALGDVDAQYNLAACYAAGDGVEEDLAAAVVWYRRAAEQGDVGAQLMLAAYYGTGKGVKKNIMHANTWYRKAAKQGEAQAQAILGANLYFGTEGTKKDYTEAVTWLTKAAKQGDATAQTLLSACYQQGQGVKKDLVRSFDWAAKAAEQGKAIAHTNLGRCYLFGNGVRKNNYKACVHFLIATHLGWRPASAQASRLREEELSSSGYAMAREEANAWMAKFRMSGQRAAASTDETTVVQRGITLSGTGTGFLISDDGYFLTCAHVIDGAQRIKVRLGDMLYRATIVRCDKHNDVALLKLAGKDFRPLSLTKSTAKMGDKVFTVGYPNPGIQGASAKYTDGAISSLSGIMDDIRTMQITVPVQGGNSGGALVDADGNVIGLVVAQINATTVFEYTGTIPQNVNFAVKTGYALPLIEAVSGLSRRLPPPRTAKSKDSSVDAVKNATGLVLVFE